MPFLKFSRDKRGFENYYLIEPPSGGRNNTHRGKSQPRVLFWFRTPPQVKVGREPFSPEVRKIIEAQYPRLVFDWPRIISTPIPPPDASDHWRERRRQEKAAKRAAREDVDAEMETAAVVEAPAASADALVAAEVVENREPVAVAAVATLAETVTETAIEDVGQIDGHVDDHVDGPESADEEEEAAAVVPAETAVAASEATGIAPGASPERRRRRRRRGRRGRPSGQPGVPGQTVPQTETEAGSVELDAPVGPEPPPTNEV